VELLFLYSAATVTTAAPRPRSVGFFRAHRLPAGSAAYCGLVDGFDFAGAAAERDFRVADALIYS